MDGVQILQWYDLPPKLIVDAVLGAVGMGGMDSHTATLFVSLLLGFATVSLPFWFAGSPDKARKSMITPPVGINILCKHACDDFDIVAIHGMDGDREKAWTHKNGVLWLRDLLPRDITNARIMTFGYDANTFGKSGSTLRDYAETLIKTLTIIRRTTDTLDRPILFLAHSLGGIVLKKALVHAAAPSDFPDERHVYNSTEGIMYFGTPHSGTGIAKFQQFVLSIVKLLRRINPIGKVLETNSTQLQELEKSYRPITSFFQTIYFYEEYPTPIVMGMEVLLVPRDSAAPDTSKSNPVQLHRDHVELVKFESEDDDAYLEVLPYASDIVKNWRDTFKNERKVLCANTRNWLDCTDPTPHQRICAPPESAGAGLAFLRHHEYTDWKAGNEYIKCWEFDADVLRESLGYSEATNGTPLRDIIVQDLMNECKDDPSRAMAFFYSGMHDKDHDAFKDFFGSLLIPLITKAREIPLSLRNVFAMPAHPDARNNNEQALMPSLYELIKTYKDVYIVIDNSDGFMSSYFQLVFMVERTMKVWARDIPPLHLLIIKRKSSGDVFPRVTVANASPAGTKRRPQPLRQIGDRSSGFGHTKSFVNAKNAVNAVTKIQVEYKKKLKDRAPMTKLEPILTDADAMVPVHFGPNWSAWPGANA